MKNKLCVLLLLITQITLYAQRVKQNDRYGNSIVYIDGLTLNSKDKYGTPLFYNDGQIIKVKYKYGVSVFYFDGIPEK